MSFHSDKGEFVTSTNVTTNASGTASAQLGYGSDKTNRHIAATASVDNGNQNVVTSPSMAIAVTGTTVQLSNPAQVTQRDTETVTATVLDADSQPVAGVTVQLSSAQGNTIAPSSIASLSDGTANFAVTGVQPGVDTLTATIPQASQTGTLEIIAPTATTLTLTASASTIQSGSTGNTSIITAVARDKNDVVVPNLPVTFTVDNNGAFTPSGAHSVVVDTDTNGQATATVGYGSDKSNRLLTVSVTAPNASSNVPVTVTGTTLSVLVTNPVVAGASSDDWKFALADADGSPIANAPLQPSITRDSDQAALDYDLAQTSAALPPLTTDANGFAPFVVNAPGSSLLTRFTVKASYGAQTSGAAFTVQQGISGVTEAKGTNFPYTENVLGSKDFGWIVPSQSGASGPEELTNSLYDYPPIQLNATDAAGVSTTIRLRAEKNAGGCGALSMNTYQSCYSEGKGQLSIYYNAADNASLARGTYEGAFTVEGRVYGTNTLFETLTINVKITKQ